jgi:hypothetical protein
MALTAGFVKKDCADERRSPCLSVAVEVLRSPPVSVITQEDRPFLLTCTEGIPL